MIDKKIFFVFLLITRLQVNAHDLKTAFFQISAIDQSCFIQIKIDRDDLEQALIKDCMMSKKEINVIDLAPLIIGYINDRLTIEFENKNSSLNYYDVVLEDEFFIIKGVFEGMVYRSDVSSVKVVNTCLIDIIDGHENIIQLALNGRKRSFRLNADRNETLIKYSIT